MAGTYTEQELIFEQYLAERTVAERNVAERTVAGLGGILVRPTIHAAWYAIWQDNINFIE